MEVLSKDHNVEQVFIIGGGYLYAEAIHHPACRKIFATHVQGNFNCDIFFAKIPSNFQRTAVESHQFGDIAFRYIDYQIV